MIDENTKLLVICPSRSRPQKLGRMLDSFYETRSEGTEIVVYVADDDPMLWIYEKLLVGHNHVIGPRKTIVEVNNYFSCEVYPNIPFYGEINDDHIYITPGWDKKLMGIIEKFGGGWGLACGNDTVHGDWTKIKHPSGAVISGNIVRALKCFVHPKLRHLGSDGYLRDVAEGIGGLFYDPDVIIEHHHFVNKKADFNNDPNYKHIYTDEETAHMEKVLTEWRRDKKMHDINRMKDAREKEEKQRKKDALHYRM